MPRDASNDYTYFKAWPNRRVLVFIESLTWTPNDSTNFNGHRHLSLKVPHVEALSTLGHKLIDAVLGAGLFPSASLSSLNIDLETLRPFVPDTNPLTTCTRQLAALTTCLLCINSDNLFPNRHYITQHLQTQPKWARWPRAMFFMP